VHKPVNTHGAFPGKPMKSNYQSRTYRFYKPGSELLFLATLFTISLMVHAAQPRGDNVAYKKFTDYLYLIGYMLWAVSPYVMLSLVVYVGRNNPTSITIAFFGSVLIIAGAAAVLIDAVFIHPDAQGALVFLFLPIYQWLAALVLLFVCTVGESSIRKSQ
jgi:hypothetical protein